MPMPLRIIFLKCMNCACKLSLRGSLCSEEIFLLLFSYPTNSVYVYGKIMPSNHNNFGIFTHIPYSAVSHFRRATILNITQFCNKQKNRRDAFIYICFIFIIKLGGVIIIEFWNFYPKVGEMVH